MNLEKNQILITLKDVNGEKADKIEMFKTIALANGWTPKINIVKTETRIVKESVRLAEFEKFKAEAIFSNFRADTNGDGTETWTYSVSDTIDNIPAEQFGKDIYIKNLMDIYSEAKLKVDTFEENRILQNKYKSVSEGLKKIEKPLVD